MKTIAFVLFIIFFCVSFVDFVYFVTKKSDWGWKNPFAKIMVVFDLLIFSIAVFFYFYQR